MLPELPETLEQIKARFPLALKKKWSVRAIEANLKGDRPGLHRENVFDFEEGVRMIASHDEGDDGPYLHLSFSPKRDKFKGAPWFRDKVREICFIFAGTQKQVCREQVTEKAVHFWFEPLSQHFASPQTRRAQWSKSPDHKSH